MRKVFIYFIIILFIPFISKGMISDSFFEEKSPNTNELKPFGPGELISLKLKDINDLTINGISICKGSTAIIKASPRDVYDNEITSGLTYEWHDDLYPSLISTNSSITINSDTITNSKVYRLIVTQEEKTVERIIWVSVTDKIRGWMGPTPDMNCEGIPIKIEAYRPSLETTFEWYKNDTLLTGENNSFITVNEEALYKVNITDPNCTRPDSSFNRYIPYYNSLFIDIAALDNDTTICNSNLITLGAVNIQNQQVPFSYQWQKNGVDIPGKTKGSISVNQSGKYRLKATQSSCVTYSKEIDIIEADKFQKPEIYSPLEALCSASIQLLSGHLDQNGNLVRSPAGRWFRNNEPVSSSNEARGLWIHSGGWYKIIRGEGTSCEVSSDSVYIGETNGYMGKAMVTLNPYKNTVLCAEYDTQFFTVQYSDIMFYGPFTFQWKKNGENIQWANSYYYTTASPGVYEVEITNGDCYLLSDPITIVRDTVYKPKIKYSELSLYCDSNRLINLTAEEAPAYEITWFKNGTPLSSPLHFFSINVNQPGDYHFQIEKEGCIGISDTITIKSGPNNDFLIVKPSASYKNESAEISIQSCSGDVKWYETETASDPFYIGKVYTTPVLNGNMSYWVSCTEEYCESDRVQVNITAENCPETIDHKGIIESRIYKSGNYIESSTNLPSGVVYDAGKAIILSPGFSVGSNEVFEARIGGCK